VQILLPDLAGAARPGDGQAAGSGPYYVAERVTNRRIVLEQNLLPRQSHRLNPTASSGRSSLTGRRLRAAEHDANDFLAVFDVPTRSSAASSWCGLNRPGGRFTLAEPLELSLRVQRRSTRVQGPAELRSGRRSTTPSTGTPWSKRTYLSVRRTDRLLGVAQPGENSIRSAGRIPSREGGRRALRIGHALPSVGDRVRLPDTEVFVANMKQLGIRSAKCLASTPSARLNQGNHTGCRVAPWGAWYADPAGAVSPCAAARLRRLESTQRSLTLPPPSQVVGRPQTDLAQRPARCQHTPTSLRWSSSRLRLPLAPGVWSPKAPAKMVRSRHEPGSRLLSDAPRGGSRTVASRGSGRPPTSSDLSKRVLSGCRRHRDVAGEGVQQRDVLLDRMVTSGRRTWISSNRPLASISAASSGFCSGRRRPLSGGSRQSRHRPPGSAKSDVGRERMRGAQNARWPPGRSSRCALGWRIAGSISAKQSRHELLERFRLGLPFLERRDVNLSWKAARLPRAFSTSCIYISADH
jgi:hypothetical protein